VPPALPQGDPAPPTGELPQSARAAVRDVPFGVYVHVPFCQTRCGYCDFNTYTADELGSGVSRGSYADTVLREIHLAAEVLRDTYLPPASTAPRRCCRPST
jgi:oxygen-independent coproporphyrinogen-3 oxidase